MSGSAQLRSRRTDDPVVSEPVVDVSAAPVMKKEVKVEPAKVSHLEQDPRLVGGDAGAQQRRRNAFLSSAWPYLALCTLASAASLFLGINPALAIGTVFGGAVRKAYESEGLLTRAAQTISSKAAQALATGQVPVQALPLSLTRIASSLAAAVAFVAHDLKDAVQRGRLYMDDYQRLNWGLGLWAAAALLNLPIGWPLLSKFTFSIMGLVYSAILALAIYQFNNTTDRRASLQNFVRGEINNYRNLARTRGPRSLLYSILAAFYTFEALTFLIAPSLLLNSIFGTSGGPLGRFQGRLLGAGMLLLRTVAFNLKDAVERGTDRGVIGGRSFKLLNAAIAAVSLMHVLLLAPMYFKGIGGPAMPFALLMWVSSSITSVANIVPWAQTRAATTVEHVGDKPELPGAAKAGKAPGSGIDISATTTRVA